MFQTITLFGNEIELYGPINTIGNLLMFLWCVFTIKECKRISTFPRAAQAKIGDGKAGSVLSWVLTFLEIVVVFLPIFLLSGPIAHAISSVFLGDKSDNYFFSIYAAPVALLLMGTLLRFSPLKLTDYATVPHIVALIFYKIACFCWGCCYGVPSETFGMMNHSHNRMEFPVQLVELACAVIMFIVILSVQRKKDRTPGLLYPLFIIMYCGSRFVSEFWRGDYPAVFGPLKGYHIQCLVGLVEGIIFLVVVLKCGKKITEFFDSKNQGFIDRCAAKTEGNKSKGKKRK